MLPLSPRELNRLARRVMDYGEARGMRRPGTTRVHDGASSRGERPERGAQRPRLRAGGAEARDRAGFEGDGLRRTRLNPQPMAPRRTAAIAAATAHATPRGPGTASSRPAIGEPDVSARTERPASSGA